MPWPVGRSLHGGVDEVPLALDGFGAPAGRLWLAGKRFVCPDPEAALTETGATTIVCLCEARELEERYPRYVRWLHTGRAVWFPIPDLHAPPMSEARRFVAGMASRLVAGEGLLMHCGAGIGRAGTMAAAVLLHLGATVEGALAVVSAARPMAGPEAGAQMDLLVGLAALERS